ncbi:transposase [Pontibacter mucosus]|uniref:transposase n=1 Tax=Pontibacter mucosus TaxID=1649266 RepID=UPI003183355B
MSKELYGQRNIIERLFGRLKEMRRFACRFAKLADCYLAFVQLAFMRICLKPYFSDTPSAMSVFRVGNQKCGCSGRLSLSKVPMRMDSINIVEPF